MRPVKQLYPGIMTLIEEIPIKARFSINVLENSQSEILLLKRSMDAGLGPGLWAFPAGHIEEVETPEDCAYRELSEEIGSDINIRLVNELGPIRDTFYGGIYQIYLFHHRWIDGTITLNNEHTDYAWVNSQDYKYYSVMDGLDEDIYYLGIWPRSCLNEAKIPPICK